MHANKLALVNIHMDISTPGVREKAAKALQALRGSVPMARTSSNVGEEMESLFNFRKKRKVHFQSSTSKRCAWKHRFVCLAYTDQTRIPISDYERDQLLDASLGEKEVEFYSLDMGFEAVKEVLFEVFPRLQEAGGFQFLKCTANKRTLEPLSRAVYTSLRVLKQRVGQARTYIRPIQRDLNLSPTTSDREQVT